MTAEGRFVRNVVLAVVLLLVLGVGGCMVGLPQYRIYRQEMRGKAALAEATWERQVQVEDAKGKLEAMRYEQDRITQEATAQGERKIITSRADSLANVITSASLEGERGARYIQYLWVNRAIDANTQLIYLPPYGQLPVSEAGRAVPRQP